jgi:hypothetical protein
MESKNEYNDEYIESYFYRRKFEYFKSVFLQAIERIKEDLLAKDYNLTLVEKNLFNHEFSANIRFDQSPDSINRENNFMRFFSKAVSGYKVRCGNYINFETLLTDLESSSVEYFEALFECTFPVETRLSDDDLLICEKYHRLITFLDKLKYHHRDETIFELKGKVKELKSLYHFLGSEDLEVSFDQIVYFLESKITSDATQRETWFKALNKIKNIQRIALVLEIPEEYNCLKVDDAISLIKTQKRDIKPTNQDEQPATEQQLVDRLISLRPSVIEQNAKQKLIQSLNGLLSSKDETKPSQNK